MLQQQTDLPSQRHKTVEAFMSFCDDTTQHEALYYLELCSFDVEKAILCYFENPTAGKRSLHKNRLMASYSRYLTAKGGPTSKTQSLLECLDRGARRICQQLKILWKELGLSCGQVFREKYGLNLNWVVFEECSLGSALKHSSDTGKPLVIFEYVKHFHHNATTVFTIETSQLLRWQFLLIGVGCEDTEIRSFLSNECGLPQSADSSNLTILRVNHCKQIVLVSQLHLTENISAMHVYNYFHESLSSISEEKALESEAINLVEQSLKGTEEAPQPTSPGSHISHEGHNSSELMEPEFEMHGFRTQPVSGNESEHKEAEKMEMADEGIYYRQKQSTIGLVSNIEAEDREEQAPQTKKKSESWQPEEGENIITIGFRLPKGGRVLRRFDRRDKIAEVFQFVEFAEDMEFQGQQDRNFDLLTVLGGKSLRKEMGCTIGDIFGDEKQETLLVKEL